jgi:O-methyltransferase
MAVSTDQTRALYLELMRKCLTGLVYADPAQAFSGDGLRPFDRHTREIGLDWPANAQSMIGHKRMLQLQRAAEFVIERQIPGDFIETGVWRGGACILLRAVLKAYGVIDRKVWLADSFAGLPPPDPERYPADSDCAFQEFKALAVPLAAVQENFRRYELLDDQVEFLVGWFKDTLPSAPVQRLAILRLDGDMYQSTMEALTALYAKVSMGGFIIIDDYGTFECCRSAVSDFRNTQKITDTIYNIDGSGVYWQKLNQ